MEITPRDQALRDLKPLDPVHFTGPAGARNFWHIHEGGQLIHVIEGAGWVQARGAAPQRIRAGDTVRAEANEEHWHGAGRSGPLAHIVVNVGDTRWNDESPAPAD